MGSRGRRGMRRVGCSTSGRGIMIRGLGDGGRLSQVLLNLISNAINHNDKPEGFVNIHYSNKKTHHKFSIEDNGIGIENVKRRLQLLYGSRYSLKTKSKGNEYIVNLKLPLL